jgi:hypothetical protein
MTATHRMITGLQLLHYIILVFMIFTSTSISHQLESRFDDAKPVYESFHDTVYARRYDKSEARNITMFAPSALNKRWELQIGNSNNKVSDGDQSYLQQAFIDMLELVTFAAENQNPQVLTRYFDANDQDDVTAIFDTVRRMAQPGGIPRPGPQYEDLRPYDLSEITILRAKSIKPSLIYKPTLLIAESVTLAFSENTNAEYRKSANPLFPYENPPTITVTDFGWGALWKRARPDLKCTDIGPKTDYKMHFLGSLILHEILYVIVVLICNTEARMWSRSTY